MSALALLKNRTIGTLPTNRNITLKFYYAEYEPAKMITSIKLKRELPISNLSLKSLRKHY